MPSLHLTIGPSRRGRLLLRTLFAATAPAAVERPAVVERPANRAIPRPHFARQGAKTPRLQRAGMPAGRG